MSLPKNNRSASSAAKMDIGCSREVLKKKSAKKFGKTSGLTN